MKTSHFSRWPVCPHGLLVAGLLFLICAVPVLAQQGPGRWSSAAPLPVARTNTTATLLPRGLVLVAGGSDGVHALGSAYLYDPARNNWQATGSMQQARSQHSANLLPNGKILVVGGVDSSGRPVAATELYDTASGTWSSAGGLPTGVSGQTATTLRDGRMLVAGGADVSGKSL